MSGPGKALPALLLLALAVALPLSPALQPLPGRDSGGYLYVAARILDGGLPYRDAWDHKPPGVYFVDALGLLIGGGSRWGVWVLEVAALGAATAASWHLLARAFGPAAGAFATGAWLITLPTVLEGGNLTEEYALPLQFSVLLLFMRLQSGAGATAGVGLGAATAAMFLLRPNLVGLGVTAAVGLALTRARSRQWSRGVAELAAAAGGAAAVLGATALCFYYGRALDDLWDQVFRYNTYYSQAGSGPGRLRAIAEGLRVTSQSGIAGLALAGWLLAASRRGQAETPATTPLVRLALAALPIELALATISGQIYPHYFMAWVPCFAVLVGIMVGSLAQSDARPDRHRVRVALAALLAGMAVLPLARAVHQAAARDDTRTRVTAYVRAHTAPSESVLVWGAEPGINFMAGRRAPGRFVYHYPLVMPGYAGDAVFGRFLDELRARPPALVIDASSGSDLVPPLDVFSLDIWPPARRAALPPGLKPALDYLLERYDETARIGAWPVYRRRPAG